jgi:predicted GIY-YIG superfamily endonuclease
MWSLYLLYHPIANRTYIGITTNIQRRLRQHRGEIVGGARFTARTQKKFPEGQWELICFLSGFENRSEVTRWERLCKIRCRGLKQRSEAFDSLGKGQHPKEFTERQKEKFGVPDGIDLHITQ